jgi:hypothetical protein
MSARTTKTPKAKRRNSGVTTASFEPGQFVEFISTGMPLPRPLAENNHEKPTNGKGAAKDLPGAADRRYLKDIEIWLNNCVNFAERLEDKRGTQILQLLRDARDQAIRIRGKLA